MVNPLYSSNKNISPNNTNAQNTNAADYAKFKEFKENAIKNNEENDDGNKDGEKKPDQPKKKSGKPEPVEIPNKM